MVLGAPHIPQKSKKDVPQPQIVVALRPSYSTNEAAVLMYENGVGSVPSRYTINYSYNISRA